MVFNFNVDDKLFENYLKLLAWSPSEFSHALASWKWVVGGKRTKRRNDRYVELGWAWGRHGEEGRGGVEVCLHALEGVRERRRRRRRRLV